MPAGPDSGMKGPPSSLSSEMKAVWLGKYC